MVADAGVKRISTGLVSSLERIDYILDRERWGRVLTSIEEAGESLNALMDRGIRSLNRLERTLAQLEEMVTDNQQPIKTAVEDFGRAMRNANIFLEKGASLASGTDDSLMYLRRYLLVVAQNLEKASENLDRLIELIANQPSQLIFGEPPVPRKMEPEVPEG